MCALSYKQLDLIVHLSLPAQGSEVPPTLAHIICISFNIGEIQ